MLEQDEHFKHLSNNPTYIRPEDWREIDSLVDWLTEKNEAGYQMVNSVQRLQEIKAFIRMASGADLKSLGWNGDGTGVNGDIAKQLAGMPGIVQHSNGELGFAEWNCRAGQNSVIVRTDGTVAPCFPMYASTHDWGNIGWAQVRRAATRGHEENVPAALLLYSQPQSCLLLQRRASDQVCVDESGNESDEGGKEFRRLADSFRLWAFLWPANRKTLLNRLQLRR